MEKKVYLTAGLPKISVMFQFCCSFNYFCWIVLNFHSFFCIIFGTHFVSFPSSLAIYSCFHGKPSLWFLRA